MNVFSAFETSIELAVDMLLLPGKAVEYLLIRYSPQLADLFDLGSNEANTLTVTASIVIWLAAIVVTGTLLTKIRDIDRTLTAWIVAGYEDVCRRIRVLKRRIKSSLALRLKRRSNIDDALVLDTLQLAGLETSVLRCLSRLDDGAVMPTGEMAAKLGRSEREIRNVLRRLVELGLIESRRDSLTRSNGHCIATAGQMYLLGA